jgi:hypothetical protein
VVNIYAIDGMAGVGKTAFARHAAQEFAKRAIQMERSGLTCMATPPGCSYVIHLAPWSRCCSK